MGGKKTQGAPSKVEFCVCEEHHTRVFGGRVEMPPQLNAYAENVTHNPIGFNQRKPA